MLQTAYDDMTTATFEHEKEPDSETKSVEYQVAKEKYNLNKKYYMDAMKPTISYAP